MTLALSRNRLFPLMARLPTALPWRLAGYIGRESAVERQPVLRWLEALFARAFPGRSADQYAQWARAHLAMLAQEMVDAMAFDRLGRFGGPRVELRGGDLGQKLIGSGQGFILVLNHYDRLLTAPVALARAGVATNVLTMPVLDNPELSAPQRDFLLRKIHGYTRATGGKWHTTADGLRAVHESLKAGQGWVILADAWRPEFGRLRAHPFLGGYLHLPTGIERLAQSTGVPMLQAVTYSRNPGHLEVVVEPLPQNPRDAIDMVVQTLERDVVQRPWAWWQWGLWDQMWTREEKPEGNP
ncbi:MAG: lysophospholipid acyltransferase family protein [Acidovorax sp.]